MGVSSRTAWPWQMGDEMMTDGDRWMTDGDR